MRALLWTFLLFAFAACGGGHAPHDERPPGGALPGDGDPDDDDEEPGRPTLRCTTLRVEPEALDVGIVQVGASADEAVVLGNDGDEACGVRVEARGAGFSTDSDWLILDPGEEATVHIRLEPTEVGTSRGTLDVWGAQTLATIPLLAEVRESCLQVEPEAIDFGTATACDPASETLLVENACSHSARIDDVILDGAGNAWEGPVYITHAPVLPDMIPGGERVSVHIEYRPGNEAEPWDGALIVYEAEHSIRVAIHGDGRAPPEPATDVFHQARWALRNFLFVVDDGPETAPWREAIADWVGYHQALHHNIAHVRWGVTSTSRVPTAGCPGSGADGRLLPLEGSGPRWLDVNGEPAPSTEELLALFDVPTCSQAPSESFAAIERAILELADREDDPVHPEPADGNAGFLYDGPARLDVVIISAREDASAGSVEDWQAALQAFTAGAPFSLGVHAIAGDPSCPGTEDGERLRALSDAHFGVHSKVCEPDSWPEFHILPDFGMASRFFLTHFPIDQGGDGRFEDDIEVIVNGDRIPSEAGGERLWRYSQQTNAVDFTPAHIPPESAEVRVNYQVSC